MKANIRSALLTLKKSGYNYIVAAFVPEMFAKVMGIAYGMGLAGEGKFWLISGTAGLAPIIGGGKFVVKKGW